MKTTKFIIGALAIALLGLQSCGKKADKLADAVEKVSEAAQSETTSDLLSNTEELQKAEDALRELPKFKGKEILVFQDINFSDNSIEITLVDPDNPKNVDQYTYQNGKWGEPQPGQLSGDGDVKENSTPLKDIKFATVAIVHKNWVEKANAVEGAEKKPSYITYQYDVEEQTRIWNADMIEGDRVRYFIKFNLDGSVKEFEKD